MTTEQWKDVEGFEGLYQVSNMGRIKSFHNKKQRIILGTPASGGYRRFDACINGKVVCRIPLHDLVVDTFIRKFDRTKEECHHKNHIRDDNRLQNLQILTKEEHRKDQVARQKMSKTRTGKQRGSMSQQTKIKIKTTKMKNGTWRKKHTEEEILKIKQAIKGKKMGHKLSQQTKLKISIANKGRKRSVQSIQKQKQTLSKKKCEVNV